jgi:peptidoglycan hydrolase-like protein with peptidoglycan-binding domain
MSRQLTRGHAAQHQYQELHMTGGDEAEMPDGERKSVGRGGAWSGEPPARGDSGPKVRALQERLKALGFDPGSVNGVYDAGTANAAKRYQADRKMTADGVVGHLTWRRLSAEKATANEDGHQAATSGTAREDVREAQDALRAAPDLAGLAEGRGNPLYLRLLGALGEPRDSGQPLPTSVGDALTAWYQQLSPPAAALFRRASLADAEGLDAELAGVLLAGVDVPAALDALLVSGLLIELPDGRADFAHDRIREYAAERLAADEDPAEVEELPEKVRRWLLVNRYYQPEPRIARDFWTTDDRLDYAPYADAIASFVRHRETLPPLTIGIKASWGAGKTSLMRMIQERLDPPVGPEGRVCRIRFTSESRAALLAGWRRRARVDADLPVTNREILGKAKRTGSPGRGFSPRLRAEPGEDTPTGFRDEWRATVWFNPWIYQSGEQVWAGLAHEIIRQITSRLPIGDQERFWLELNLARLDRDAVRRRTYRAIWERLLPFLIVLALATLVSLVMLAVGSVTGAGWVTTLANFGVASGAVIAVTGGLTRMARFFTEAAAGPFHSLISAPDLATAAQGLLAKEFTGSCEQLFPDPGYGSKLGFLHLVQADMKRVLDLVATEREPLVVFVDDLDRCSPGTVAQVIEAISLFLAGEFPNCVFILAMEPALVAAHIEVTYKDLVAALKQDRTRGEWSTLGWRFLEKIVQLPLSLPPPQAARGLEGYVRSLLSLDSLDAVPAAPLPSTPGDAMLGAGLAADVEAATQTLRDPTAGLRNDGDGSTANKPAGGTVVDLQLANRLADAIRARHPNVTTLPEVARRVQAELVPAADPERLLPESVQACEYVFADLYSDADAVSAIKAALPALASANPREIKRYINLFRFYTFIVQRQRLQGVPAPSGESIAKLAALAIRWPHLLSTLGQRRSNTERPMSALERSARAVGTGTGSDVDSWRAALELAGLLTQATDGGPALLPEWSVDLREFLANGPEVGEAASRLL